MALAESGCLVVINFMSLMFGSFFSPGKSSREPQLSVGLWNAVGGTSGDIRKGSLKGQHARSTVTPTGDFGLVMGEFQLVGFLLTQKLADLSPLTWHLIFVMIPPWSM